MLIPLIRKTHGKSLKVYCRIFFCGNYAIKIANKKVWLNLATAITTTATTATVKNTQVRRSKT